MHAKVPNGFSLGKLDDLDWDEIEGHAAETKRSDGNVRYRGKFLCTVFNDDDGGDILGADGEHMGDKQVQSAIDSIDLHFGA